MNNSILFIYISDWTVFPKCKKLSNGLNWLGWGQETPAEPDLQPGTLMNRCLLLLETAKQTGTLFDGILLIKEHIFIFSVTGSAYWFMTPRSIWGRLGEITQANVVREASGVWPAAARKHKVTVIQSVRKQQECQECWEFTALMHNLKPPITTR